MFSSSWVNYRNLRSPKSVNFAVGRISTIQIWKMLSIKNAPYLRF